MPQASDVLAAGAVVFRPGREVLLVHRPKYDDWSFPKGKLDRGEMAPVAAVREVAEETGLTVRLCVPLASQRYPVAAGPKTVFYWTGRCVGDDDVSGYHPNHEVDKVRWVPYNDALALLTYERDRDTLRAARKVRRRTHAVVVLRHGAARSRRTWRDDDGLRPLVQAGRRQAEALVPLLAAYDVTWLLSSTSTRCVETLAPYAEATGLPLETSKRLSEEGWTEKSVTRLVDAVVEARRGAVLCTHGPVLPAVFEALGLEDPGLDKGEMLVVHLRNGEVRSTERHSVR